jgi:hypothetical protein
MANAGPELMDLSFYYSHWKQHGWTISILFCKAIEGQDVVDAIVQGDETQEVDHRS